MCVACHGQIADMTYEPQATDISRNFSAFRAGSRIRSRIGYKNQHAYELDRGSAEEQLAILWVDGFWKPQSQMIPIDAHSVLDMM